MLQRHLVSTKLGFAKKEHELLEKLRERESECEQLKADYEIARDELQLCWSYVDQMKKENTLKWRCEERDDWRALVTSLQQDRQRLLRENATLRSRLEEFGDHKQEDVVDAQPTAAADDDAADFASSSSSSSE